MRYTIRNISTSLDKAVKARAKQLGKSVNALVLEALAQSVAQPAPRRKLRQMPGSWSRAEAAEFDRFLVTHRKLE